MTLTGYIDNKDLIQWHEGTKKNVFLRPAMESGEKCILVTMEVTSDMKLHVPLFSRRGIEISRS